MPKLLVVIASTRPGRIGLPIGQWAAKAAEAHGKFEIELADLAEIALPFLDEPNHPRTGQYVKEHTKAWSTTVDSADAFLFVMPEYNHFPPATLINAISFLGWEWAYKPFGTVTYGGVSAGLRGFQALKELAPTLKLVPIPDGPTIPFVAGLIKDGSFMPTPIITETVPFHLDEVFRWAQALAPLRAQVPQLRRLLPPGVPQPATAGSEQ